MSAGQRAAAAARDGTRTRLAQPQAFVVDSQRLQQLRKERGLSQEELAGQAGVSLSTVTRLERGRPGAPCRGRTLGRLARALGEQPATTSLRAGESALRS